MIMIGPQGAGKGTQGARLAQRYDIPHIATGDLLRMAVRAGSPLGVEAKGYMDRGELVPDVLVLDMLRERLSQPDARAGFVLDGYPRNPSQAESLGKLLDEVGAGLDVVVSLEVADEILIERLSARRTCPACGRNYTQQGGEPTVCAADGTELDQRDDDKPDAIARRLAIFHEQTRPLIAFYERDGLVARVDGTGTIDEVEARITKELEARA